MAFQIKYVYDLVDKLSPILKKIQNNLDQNANAIKQTANKIGSSFEGIGTKLEKISKKTGAIGKELFVKATLPVALLAGTFIKAASDYQESINKVDVAFGSASKSVKEFASNTGKNFGIDRGSALDMSATFGDMSTAMGLSQDLASSLSTKLVGLAGDLASFKNIGVDQAVTALGGVFTGETESLKSLGVVMTETNLKQFALGLGIKKNLKNFSQAEKVLLRYKYVMQAAANSQGDFARTSEGFANQTRVLRSKFKDLSITLGTMLLPYALQLVQLLIKLTDKFQALSPKTQKIILILAGVAAVIGPILIAISLMLPALAFLGTAFGVLGTLAMGAVTILRLLAFTPLGLIITAVTLLIVYWDELVVIFKKAFDWISKIVSKLDIVKNFKDAFAFGFGDGGVNNFNTNNTLQQTPINQSQGLGGGRLDVNFSNMPKGTNTAYTPMPSSNLVVGTMSEWRR